MGFSPRAERRWTLQDRRYDLAIVGAGFSGPILAAKIAERGVKPGSGNPLAIALIDAGPYYKGAARPGYGSALRRRIFTNLEGSIQHENDGKQFKQWHRYSLRTPYCAGLNPPAQG